LGLADSLTQPKLTRLLARCREEEPLTEIHIIEMTAYEMVKALNYDQIDVGFTVHAGTNHGIVKEAVWVDRLVIAIPKNHPLLSFKKISPQEIPGQRLILCHPESCSEGCDVILHWFSDFGLPEPTIAEYVSGHEPMMMLVAAGYGIGLKSQIALYNHPDVIVCPITDEMPNAATYIVTQDKPSSDTLTRFIDRARQIGQMEIH
jgi:DNA-binding transcriptional LysR family regulator